MSFMLAGFMAVVASIYTLIVHGTIILDSIFDAGVIVGALMVVVGLLKYFPPGIGQLLIRSDRLLDRSTFIERTSEERQHKISQGYEYICIGILTALITGLLQHLAGTVFERQLDDIIIVFLMI